MPQTQITARMHAIAQCDKLLAEAFLESLVGHEHHARVG